MLVTNRTMQPARHQSKCIGLQSPNKPASSSLARACHQRFTLRPTAAALA